MQHQPIKESHNYAVNQQTILCTCTCRSPSTVKINHQLLLAMSEKQRLIFHFQHKKQMINKIAFHLGMYKQFSHSLLINTNLKHVNNTLVYQNTNQDNRTEGVDKQIITLLPNTTMLSVDVVSKYHNQNYSLKLLTVNMQHVLSVSTHTIRQININTCAAPCQRTGVGVTPGDSFPPFSVHPLCALKTGKKSFNKRRVTRIPVFTIFDEELR